MGGSQTANVATLRFAMGTRCHELTLNGELLAEVEIRSDGWHATVEGRQMFSRALDELLSTILVALKVATNYEAADALGFAVAQAWWLNGRVA